MSQSFEMGPSTRALYVISVAAELAGVHPQTLRIYERKGLVGPARTDGGSRRYSDADIALLKRIQELTNAGVNLEGVRRILALEAKVFHLSHQLDAVRAAVAEATARPRFGRDIVPFSGERMSARWSSSESGDDARQSQQGRR